MIETRPRDLDLKTTVGDKQVSTVALTVEHFGGAWYETMIFPCDEAGTVTDFGELYMDRYSTREQAERGHEQIVEQLRARDAEPLRPGRR